MHSLKSTQSSITLPAGTAPMLSLMLWNSEKVLPAHQMFGKALPHGRNVARRMVDQRNQIGNDAMMLRTATV